MAQLTRAVVDDLGSTDPELARRLVGDEVLSYDDDTGGELFLGGLVLLEARALVHQTYHQAFPDGALTDNEQFDGQVTSIDLEDAGYVELADKTGWRAPSGTLTRDDVHFFVPTAHTDPFGNATTVAYDTACLAFAQAFRPGAR